MKHYRHTTAHPSIFRSDAEYQFAALWLELFPAIDLHHELAFAKPRRYTLDFAHLDSKTAIEIQGGTWVSGMGHSNGVGIKRDAEKSQLAAQHGWQIIPILTEDCTDPLKMATIAQVIEQRSKQKTPA